MRRFTLNRFGSQFLWLLFPWLIIGCGGKPVYPVKGKIVFKDGKAAKELAGGTVGFESFEEPISARGTIQGDGSFEMSTFGSNDGAWVGKHKVVITPPDPIGDNVQPAVMHPKYKRFKDSKLTVTIEPKTNEMVLTLERANQTKPTIFK